MKYRNLIVVLTNTNDPNALEEYGGTLNLTDRWARHVLTKMEWTKRKGTTGKVEPLPQFLVEEKFTFQRAISAAISEHDIPTSLVITLDQTPLAMFLRESTLLVLKEQRMSPSEAWMIKDR